MKLITTDEINQFGIDLVTSKKLKEKINFIFMNFSAEVAWEKISKSILTPGHPFPFHLFLFSACYPTWQTHPELAPVAFPEKNKTHLSQLMKKIKPK